MLSKKAIGMACSLLVFGGAGWFGYATAKPDADAMPAAAVNDKMEALLAESEPGPEPSKAELTIKAPQASVQPSNQPSVMSPEQFEADHSAQQADSTGEGSAELVDLNSATQEQLMKLPGIGESKARAIMEMRSRVGKFRTVDQLLEVKGIGNKVLEKLKPHVKVGGA